MAQCLFDKCCCCIDLRLGSFILGYLETIFCSTEALRLLFIISNFNKRIYYHLLLVGCFIFGVVLLFGLHKNKRENVKYYLMYAVFFMAAYFILVIVYITVWESKLVGCFISFGDILFKTYAFLIVRSYYYVMEDETGDTEEV